MNIKELLVFNKFLTPSLVRIVYWIGLLALCSVVIGAIRVVLSPEGGVLSALIAVLAFVIGAILWRVVCEGIILTFSMFDRMTEIRDRLPKSNSKAR